MSGTTPGTILGLSALLLLLGGCGEDKGRQPSSLEDYFIAQSDTTIDCKGGLFNKGIPTEVQIRGPIQGVTIRNCVINGSVRTLGMARTGEGKKLRSSSQSKGHTKRAQAAAPSKVLLQDVIINANQATPLYLGPGTTGVTLRNFHLLGSSRISAIYLDAESARNTIEDGIIDVKTPREQVAVDGSADNKIRRVEFMQPSRGGIFLYRNCGEGGTVRHQSPSRNLITDNLFHSDLPLKALIRVNSRDGNRSYCGDDKGFPFGSSANDRDGGKANIIRRNTVKP